MKISRNNLYITLLLIVVGVLSVGTLLNSCNAKTDTTYKLTGNVVADGEALVQLKCARCHEAVPLNTLDKAVWLNHTLPAMAKYLHIGVYGGDQYFKNNPLDTTGASLVEWQALVAYYKKEALDSLPKSKKPVAFTNDLAGFTVVKAGEVNTPVFTTLVTYNADAHKIYTSDASTTRIYEWGADLKSNAIENMPSPVVAANFVKEADGKTQGLFTCIGQLQPVDFPDGKVIGLSLSGESAPAATEIASELARPVQTLSGDFNKDGLNDLVVCSQGFKTGGVYLFTQKSGNTYNQSTITDKPGAVQAVAGDFNNDGWPDVMVLFGTGDEGLWVYLNDHNGGFTSRNLLRFPPVYGSTSFQLADIDHDGKPDLVYTCGYNFHDSRILKPYHGLYIFKNTGDWNFKQQWFYPINGCTKAIAADFAGDGKLGIATIAFFADLKNNPAEGCIYFEPDKSFSFKPHAIPVSQYGRWMCMDVADYNNDGKPDIILGNYSSGFLFQQDFKPTWNRNIPFIILENNFKK